ncbi:IS3 family transposase [Rhizobium beringeri]
MRPHSASFLQKMVGPAAKREAVTHLKAVMGLSERRACQIVSADRKTIRYRSNRPPEVDLRAKLRDLANERRRFGYRRLFILLRRDGEPSGVNRIYRLYREEGLSVRKAKGPSACCRHACADPGRSEGQCPLVAGFRALTSLPAVDASGC